MKFPGKNKSGDCYQKKLKIYLSFSFIWVILTMLSFYYLYVTKYKTLLKFNEKNDNFFSKEFKQNHFIDYYNSTLPKIQVYDDFEDFPKSVLKQIDVLVVGSGLAGSVLSNLISKILNKKVLVIEKLNRIGGKLYENFDENKILTSVYGEHVFFTNNDDVWNYLNSFSEFLEYYHKVRLKIMDNSYTFPFFINNFDQLIEKRIFPKNENFLFSCERKTNVDVVREDLFHEYFFFNNRLNNQSLFDNLVNEKSIRCDYGSNLFSHVHQGVPKYGYTMLISQILNHPNIYIVLNQNFNQNRNKFKHLDTFYTGNIDEYFNYNFGELDYYGVRYLKEKIKKEYYQPSSVIYYPSLSTGREFLKVVEFKHFPYNDFSNIRSKSTVIWKQIFEKWSGKSEIVKNFVKYIPINDKKNQKIYQKYSQLRPEKDFEKINFVGGLWDHKFYSMGTTIEKTFALFEKTYQISLKDHINHQEKKENEKISFNIILSIQTKEFSSLFELLDIIQNDERFKIKIFWFDNNYDENKILTNYNLELAKKKHGIKFEIVPNRKILGKEGKDYLYYILFKSHQYADINLFFSLEEKIDFSCLQCFQKVIKFLEEKIKKDISLLSIQEITNHFFSLMINDFIRFDKQRNIKNFLQTEFCYYYKKIIQQASSNGSNGRDVVCSYPFDSNQLLFPVKNFIVTKQLLRRVVSSENGILFELYNVISNGGSNSVDNFFLRQLWVNIFQGNASLWKENNVNSICLCFSTKMCFKNPLIIPFIRKLDCEKVQKDPAACSYNSLSVSKLFFDVYIRLTILFYDIKRIFEKVFFLSNKNIESFS